MKRTSRNPTRRKGPRTGGIPVSEATVTRILNKIFRSPQAKKVRVRRLTPKGYVLTKAPYGDKAVMFMPARSRKRYRSGYSIEVEDKIASYATGKTEPLVVTVLDKERAVPYEHSGAGGWQRSTRLAKVSKVPKKERLARIDRALAALGLRVTPKRVKRLLASAFARTRRSVGRTAHIALVSRFGVPTKKERLRLKLGNVLRHELAHAMDESARKAQMRREETLYEDDRSELERDATLAVWILGLPRRHLAVWEDTRPRPLPARVKRTSRPSARAPRQPQPRVFDAAYFNDPKEVTARIVEILHELGGEDGSFRAELLYAPPRATRSERVLEAMRNSSETFVRIEPVLTPQNFARVVRAVYDRYHTEPWFPQAGGILKNRRTSRRVR
jgi:hypothetical protein